MKFEPGEMVWIGWFPEEYIGDAGDARLQQATVKSPSPRAKFNGIGWDNSYRIETKDGRKAKAPESDLIKIPPEEYGRQKEKQDEKPTATV